MSSASGTNRPVVQIVLLTLETQPIQTFDELRSYLKTHYDLYGANLYIPLRRALTGQETGEPLDDLFAQLGRQEVVRRLQSIC